MENSDKNIQLTTPHLLLDNVSEHINQLEWAVHSVEHLMLSDSTDACSLITEMTLLWKLRGEFQTIFAFWDQLRLMGSDEIRSTIDTIETDVISELDKHTVDCRIIRWNKGVESNIQWLNQHNREFLFDLNLNSISVLQQTDTVTAVFFNTGNGFYKNKGQWEVLALDPMISKLQMNCDNIKHSYIFWIVSLSQLFSLLEHHAVHVVNRVLKYDRYIVMDRAFALHMLHYVDLSILDRGNHLFHFLLSENWENRLTQLTEKGILPPFFYMASPQQSQHIIPNLKKLHDKIIVDTQVLTDKINKMYTNGYYEAACDGYRRKKKQSRVILLTSRYSTFVQHSTKDLAQGFRKIGSPALVFKEKRNQGAGYLMHSLYKKIQRVKPDFLFSIDNFRMHDKSDLSDEIPFVSWIQDSFFTHSNPECMKKNDYIFVLAKKIRHLLLQQYPAIPADHVHILPPLLKPGLFQPDPSAKIKYDVSYVAHLNLLPEITSYYLPDQRLNSAKETVIHEMLRRMEDMDRFDILSVKATESSAWEFLHPILEQLELLAADKSSTAALCNILRNYVSMFLLKIQPIKYIVSKGIKKIALFGTGWDLFSEFQPYAKGTAAYGKALNQIYNQSAINLNLSPELSFHPKVSEVMGASGFLLTPWKGSYDYQPLEDYFLEGDEVVLFKSYPEMMEKIQFYLDNVEQRRAIAMRAHQKILEMFTVKHGAEMILKTVFG